MKLDESFFVLELWQNRQVSLAVQSGDFIVTARVSFPHTSISSGAEEITAGEQITFTVAEKLNAYSGYNRKNLRPCFP